MQLKKDDLKDLDELPYLQSKVKQVRLAGKLCKQCFRFDMKELFEPISNAVRDSNQKILEETRTTTKAIEGLDELNFHKKAFESMTENG